MTFQIVTDLKREKAARQAGKPGLGRRATNVVVAAVKGRVAAVKGNFGFIEYVKACKVLAPPPGIDAPLARRDAKEEAKDEVKPEPAKEVVAEEPKEGDKEESEMPKAAPAPAPAPEPVPEPAPEPKEAEEKVGEEGEAKKGEPEGGAKPAAAADEAPKGEGEGEVAEGSEPAPAEAEAGAKEGKEKKEKVRREKRETIIDENGVKTLVPEGFAKCRIFFHISEILEGVDLNVGDMVEFIETINSRTNELNARKILRTKEAPVVVKKPERPRYEEAEIATEERPDHLKFGTKAVGHSGDRSGGAAMRLAKGPDGTRGFSRAYQESRGKVFPDTEEEEEEQEAVEAVAGGSAGEGGEQRPAGLASPELNVAAAPFVPNVAAAPFIPRSASNSSHLSNQSSQ